MAAKPNHWKAACASAAVVLAVTAGAVVHWRTVGGRREAIAAVEAKTKSVAQANAAAEQAVRDLPGLRSAAVRFAKRVPPDANLGTLLGSAGTGTGDAGEGTPEREIVTKPTVSGQPVARVPFLLQYRGSFASAVTLLKRFRDGPLLTQIERVTIENDATTEGDKSLRVQVEFSTFARTSKELEAWSQAE